MKQVVIVTPYFAPAWSYGGPPRVLYTLAKAFVDEKVNVSIITSDSLGEVRSKVLEEKLDGISIHRFPTISNTLASSMKLFYIPYLREKVEHILVSADVVLFSDTRSILSWQLYRFLITHDIPYAIFPFGQILYDHSFRKYLKKVFDLLWVHDFFSAARWIFGQTKHECTTVAKHFNVVKERIFFLPLPIESIPYIPKKADTLQQFGIPKDHITIVYVGRFHFLKGLDLLFRSVAPLLSNNKKLHLLLIGKDDGFLPRIERMISPRLKNQIHISKPIYEKDLWQIYKSSRCFIHTPKYYEETSTAALEALSCGCPVVTTLQADIPYLFQYHAGYVVSPTEQNIRGAVLKVLGKKNYNGIANIIRDHYLSKRVVKKLIQYLNEI